MLRAGLAMTALTCSARAGEPDPAIVHREFVYEQAPFPQCHASTLAETPQGLVAAWFGGTREKHPDVGIWFARQEKSGWSAPREVANGVQSAGPRHPCWNPVLFQAPDGPLLLFYKVGPDPSHWWGELMTSLDAGQTWSQSRRLPQGILGPVKNKPVLTADGVLLCGSSSEHDGWRVHFERSGDLGKTWDIIGPVNDGKKIGAIQPSILFHGGDKLQAIGRSRQGKVFEVWSDDSGKTWGPMGLTALPNPNSGTDAVTLADGRQLIVYNHTSKGRSPLNVAVSNDGRTWQAALTLENEPGEYSYPAVIQTADRRVHITYTWKRQRVRHVALDPQQFKLREIVDGRWPE